MVTHSDLFFSQMLCMNTLIYTLIFPPVNDLALLKTSSKQI